MYRKLSLLIVFIVLCTQLPATTINVPADYATIQAGIDAATNGDLVLVADGTYYENINFKGKAITVASHFLTDDDTTHISNTIIDGSKASDSKNGSVVSFISEEDTTSVICGFTITGGTGTLVEERVRGGGICVFCSGARISHNKIISNAVRAIQRVYGGGISAEDKTADHYIIIEKNLIHNNQALSQREFAYGGGIDIRYQPNFRVVNNIISQNIVVGPNGCFAPSVRLVSAAPTSKFEYNYIAYNSYEGANCSGGMLAMNVDGGFTIERNTFRGNKGGGGGALIVGDCNLTIQNNIFFENEADNGGAIYIMSNPPTVSAVQIINNTIVSNVANNTGGGILTLSSTVLTMNSILWGNSSGTGAQIYVASGTLDAVYSAIQGGWQGEGNIDVDPLFADSFFRLSDSSRCIGAGIASTQIDGTTYSCPNSDIEDHPRPNPPGSKPDLGACENPLAAPSGPILVPEQYATIQAGINAAQDGDTVLVAEGTYYENINFKGKAITVAGHFLMDGDTTHINNTIIDGSKPTNPDSGSVVFFVSGEDTTSVLQGFTITGGTGTETSYWVEGLQYFCRAGGGIFCFNSGARFLNNKIIASTVNSPDKSVQGGGLAAFPYGSAAFVILKNNQIMHNTVTAHTDVVRGGGVHLFCNGKLLNNQISYNSVVQNATDQQAVGGAVFCRSDVTDRRNVIIESNKITHNSVVSYSDLEARTAFGGGCLINGNQGRLTNNEVSHNKIRIKTGTNAVGGGMEVISVANSFVIDGNIIKENSVSGGYGWGGGIGFYDCSPYTANNIISENSVTSGGGGLYITLNVNVQLVNNTIVGNHASEYGGGIIVSSSAAPVLMNCILWNNTSPTGAAIDIEDGTVQTAYCDIQGGWSGTENIDDDPQLSDSFTLLDSSPCIGRGIASFDFGGGLVCSCPETDMAGHHRPDPAGSSPDMGAYESPRENPINNVMNLTKAELPQSFSLAQNYPNPFNPGTTFEFALPKSAFVTLKVYNLRGEQVATLLAEQRQAGIHRFNWDASGLASGVYLYRLEAAEFVQTKKLILMR